jgi:hypothetical protein
MRTLTLILALATVGFTLRVTTALADGLAPAADRMTAAVNRVTH